MFSDNIRAAQAKVKADEPARAKHLAASNAAAKAKSVGTTAATMGALGIRLMNGAAGGTNKFQDLMLQCVTSCMTHSSLMALASLGTNKLEVWGNPMFFLSSVFMCAP